MMEKDSQMLYEDNIFELFDSQFSISVLKDTIDCLETKSDRTIESAKEAIKKSIADPDEGKKYRVDIPDDVREAIESGDVEFVKGKNGEIYAQLRKSNGQFAEKLSITEELESSGVTFDELRIAIQMEAIAEQLKAVVDTLVDIEAQIAEARIDHRNDRIGYFYSGISLYMEASQVEDDGLRKQIMSQALRAISDSNSQMIQEIRTSIEFLTNGQYKKRKNSLKLIDDNLTSIKQCYEIVYRSAIMKALIYQENGEIRAMTTALDEYGRFIDRMILPYMGVLSELDKDSKFITKGPWGKIGNTLISCISMKEALSMNNRLVIEMR